VETDRKNKRPFRPDVRQPAAAARSKAQRDNARTGHAAQDGVRWCRRHGALSRPEAVSIVVRQNPSRPSPTGGYASLDGTCRTSHMGHHLAGKKPGEEDSAEQSGSSRQLRLTAAARSRRWRLRERRLLLPLAAPAGGSNRGGGLRNALGAPYLLTA
jgi:hypothetical protein